ncbi:MAG: DeoR/GlpR family DNA-binding transcription regulator [Planctomycetota bacterium]|jgi:DeoR/GlpR family transcriptional regulator of sugar metabolism
MASQQNRQQAIMEQLSQEGRLTVEELAERFSVTPMTVRRDLTAMEEEGLITRTHGGCVLRSPFVPELSFTEKDAQAKQQKRAIAEAVVSSLQGSESLYLDTGTTAVQVAELLPTGKHFSVFTNNLLVAMTLFGRDEVSVTVFGGSFGRKSPDLTGEMALAQLKRFRFELAIVGADALAVESGELFAADTPSAEISRLAQEQAGRTVIALDSSKLDKTSLVSIRTLQPGDTVVTDGGMSSEQRNGLEAHGAKVVVAVT